MGPRRVRQGLNRFNLLVSLRNTGVHINEVSWAPVPNCRRRHDAIMLVIAIDVIVRYPHQLRAQLIVAAASSLVLGAFAAYDLTTGHARTTRIFTSYVGRYVMPRSRVGRQPLRRRRPAVRHLASLGRDRAMHLLSFRRCRLGTAGSFMAARSLKQLDSAG
jgi:hypothetical protein